MLRIVIFGIIYAIYGVYFGYQLAKIDKNFGRKFIILTIIACILAVPLSKAVSDYITTSDDFYKQFKDYCPTCILTNKI